MYFVNATYEFYDNMDFFLENPSELHSEVENVFYSFLEAFTSLNPEEIEKAKNSLANITRKMILDKYEV